MRMSEGGGGRQGLGPTGAASDLVRGIVERHRSLEGPLLPVLHAVQDELACIPPECVPIIARGLNLSRAEVHGVISFYPLFRTAPPGRKVIYVCRAESCQAMGGLELEAHAKKRLGIDYGGTTADGELSLEPIYCLGNCACSPSVMVDGRLHSRVDARAFDQLIGR